MLRRTFVYNAATAAAAATAQPTTGAALKTRRSSARHQMLFTKAFIAFMRKACDYLNVVIYFIQKPFRKFVNVWTQEAAVFYVIFGSLMGGWLPYVLYPYLQEILDPDLRQKKEEERIRVNLQKGNDPLPFMRDKDNIRGQAISTYVTDETSIRLNIDGDMQSMERYRESRQSDLDATRRREEEWIRLETEHRKGQFGVFAHLDRFGHMDRYRGGRTFNGPAWSPNDPKGPQLPLIPKDREIPVM